MTPKKQQNNKKQEPYWPLWERLDLTAPKFDKASGEILPQKPQNTDGNLVKILIYDPRFQLHIRKNDLADLIEYKGEAISDYIVLKIKLWIEEIYSLKASKDRVFDAIYFVAHEQRYDPLRIFLEGATAKM